MRMDRQADVRGVGTHLECETDLRDQVACIRANNRTAEQAIGLLVEQQLGEAFVAPQ